MQQVLWVGAVGLSVALCAWFVLELDGRRLLGSMRASAARVDALRAARRGKAAGATVTLGQVSEMVDVIRLGLSAGLSFDAALGMYCEHSRDALASRMARARLGWQMGMETREEGLMAVARDVEVRQLESFAVSVGQAHALGAPLADTLARQGHEIRAAHRAAVEREIERAPVKMLIPTGVLILPALLLSIVGPLIASSGAA